MFESFSRPQSLGEPWWAALEGLTLWLREVRFPTPPPS